LHPVCVCRSLAQTSSALQDALHHSGRPTDYKQYPHAELEDAVKMDTSASEASRETGVPRKTIADHRDHEAKPDDKRR